MNKAKLSAIFSAIFYAISIPISKILLANGVHPIVLGSFMYLGAGFGLFLCNVRNSFCFQNPLTKNELPYTIAMVIFDILAIIILMFGLTKINPANASLLSNFEIAATSLIAYFIFKEHISEKLWSAIVLIIIASIILTYEGMVSFSFSTGSILVLFAYLFWGIENNCTKMISSKNSQEITIIKGVFSGLGSLIIVHLFNFPMPKISVILFIMLAGFISYGISVSMYIYSQNKLGAAKTAAYFSFAPYIAALLSIIFLKELPEFKFYVAFLLMFLAGFIIFKDNVIKPRS